MLLAERNLYPAALLRGFLTTLRIKFYTSKKLTFYISLSFSQMLDHLTQEGSLCKGGVGGLLPGAGPSQSCPSELLSAGSDFSVQSIFSRVNL